MGRRYGVNQKSRVCTAPVGVQSVVNGRERDMSKKLSQYELFYVLATSPVMSPGNSAEQDENRRLPLGGHPGRSQPPSARIRRPVILVSPILLRHRIILVRTRIAQDVVESHFPRAKRDRGRKQDVRIEVVRPDVAPHDRSETHSLEDSTNTVVHVTVRRAEDVGREAGDVLDSFLGPSELGDDLLVGDCRGEVSEGLRGKKRKMHARVVKYGCDQVCTANYDRGTKIVSKRSSNRR